MSYEIVKLEKVSHFIRNGASIKQGQIEGGYPITRIETIANGKIDETRVGYAGITDKNIYNDYFLENGDILISHINSEKHLGKSAIYFGEKEKLIHGMNLLCFRSIQEILNPKYALYFFKSRYFLNQIPKITKKSVNQASMSINDIKKLEIILPPIPTQLKIADSLDKAQELIDKKKEQIQKYDEFLQSVFLDMFGDPMTNSKKWETLPWKECFKTTTGKLNANAMVENGQYPFFTCSKEHFYIDKYDFNCEALILSGNNAVGKYDVKYYNGKFNAYQRTYILELQKNYWNYSYFKYILESKLLFLQKNSIGSNTKYITMGILNRINFMIPSINLQNRFASIVEKVEEEKKKLETSLTELENNFNSIMQRAFKGELF